jgi:hypothetical protein
MRAPALALSALLLLSGCSSGGAAPDPGVTVADSTEDPNTLPTGKDDLVLEAKTYYSPVDFVPALALTVPAGWHSTHRADDAFDLSLPDPARDAPLVAVVLLTPTAATVAPTLARLRARASTATTVSGTLAGAPATGFTFTGGTGELVRSPAGTIALDLAPGQRVQVLGADLDGTPLLVVTIVPDPKNAVEGLRQASALIAAITPG